VTTTACGSAQRANGGSSDASGVVDSTTAAALKAEGTLTVIDNTYSSQPIQAAMVARAIDEFGGETKIMQMADYPGIWKFMSKTPNVLHPEMWIGLTQAQYDEYVTGDHSVVTLPSAIKGSEGWFVPTYVIKGDPSRGIKPMCPGLPDWNALNQCVDVFKTAQTGDKGQYMMGAKSWVPSYGDDKRIVSLGLNYEMTYAGSEAALNADWKRAYDAGVPFLGLLWSPTYTALKYDVTKIEFPPYTKECWKTNYACDWPDMDIQNLASANVEKDHPLGYQVFQKYNLDDAQVRQLMIMVNEDGLTAAQAVDKWWPENQATWEKWAPTPAAS
jgi:glycine betaine/proline transport system substrate-binding protein